MERESESEDAKRRATPTTNQQPQPQDPTHQRFHCTMLRVRAQGWKERNIIGQGGEEAQNCKKQHKSCRRSVGNGGDLGGKRRKRKHESVGSVAADPDYLENINEAGREAQGTQGLRNNCTNVESLPFVFRGFCSKYHCFPPWEHRCK